MAPAPLSSLFRRLRGANGVGVAERQADEPGSPWWGEHLARYQFALRYLRPGLPALDIACGTGFGVSMLREHGARVCGVDISDEATRRAAMTAAGPNRLVLRADGTRLPFGDRAFSLITSFETIEHLTDRGAFARELARVLAPGGVCLFSTPNAFYSRPVNGKPTNPYHVHEYEPDELGRELVPHFGKVEIVGQILDGRFRVPPFWVDQQRLPRTPRAQTGLFARRIMHRLPGPARDRASRALWGHDFFPTAADYHFDLASVRDSQVLVAICSV